MTASRKTPSRKTPKKSPQRDAPPRKRASARQPWWKRPVTWIGTFAGTAALATASVIGARIGQNIPSPVAGAAARTGPPVIVESVGPLLPFEDYSYVVPRKLELAPAQLAAMNRRVGVSVSDYAGWFSQHGGILAHQGTISITVRGNANGRVTISDMELVKHCRGPLLHGATLFYSPTQGGGAFNTDQIGYNLDSQVSAGQFVPGEGTRASAGGNYFSRKVVVLSPGEPQTFSIFVTTTQHYCQFYFQLHTATPDGHPVTEDIKDGGQLFQLTSDGETPGSSRNVRFGSYGALYAGGAANGPHDGAFVHVNPATYRGFGNPASFPPP